MNQCVQCSSPCNARFCTRSCSATYQHAQTDHRQRFWSKVEKGDGCWEWKTGRDRDGYGVFFWKVQGIGAHRASWMFTNGDIPPGLHVLHKCDNPPCVRPDHLFLGTNLDNQRDCMSKGRTARGDKNGARKYPERLFRGPMPPRDPAKIMRGEGHPNSKLNDDKVRLIRRLLAEGRSNKEVARLLSVCDATISYIKRGKLWAHVA